MKKIMKSRAVKTALLAAYDALALTAADMLALMLRYNFARAEIDQKYIQNLFLYLPLEFVVLMCAFVMLRVYKNLWRFASIREYSLIIIGATAAYAINMIIREFTLLDQPFSCYFISWVIFCSAVIGGRVIYRVVRGDRTGTSRPCGDVQRRVMLIGAGEAGNILIRELSLSAAQANRRIVCIIDDDPAKKGSRMGGIKIVGGREDIPRAAEKYSVNEIIFAIPSVSPEDRVQILNICKNLRCSMKTLPGISQLVNNEINSATLVDVDVEDFLGRAPVKTDIEDIIGYIKDRTILVTGGGGSIGSELCRQIASHSPKKLLIIDIYENNAYDIQNELLRRHPDVCILVLIASVRDEARLDAIFAEHKPDIVFHAAAHKHVPLMEASPGEAVKNNVLGTLNTVRTADRHKVSGFVMISTDKAVNPTNVMGATKRICEMIIQMYNNRSKTEFVAVRFGNVLGSNGSVIPLFKKQIEAGGPVTVTHGDIIRYFMTIPEAVSLVLKAGALAHGGEIFILNMGQPVKILDLAENLIRLSGRTPYVDIDIEFTGLRPGEKLYEEVLMDEEGMSETEDELIFIAHPVNFDTEELEKNLVLLQKEVLSEAGDVRAAIERIVPIKEAIEQNEKEKVRTK